MRGYKHSCILILSLSPGKVTLPTLSLLSSFVTFLANTTYQKVFTWVVLCFVTLFSLIASLIIGDEIASGLMTTIVLSRETNAYNWRYDLMLRIIGEPTLQPRYIRHPWPHMQTLNQYSTMIKDTLLIKGMSLIEHWKNQYYDVKHYHHSRQCVVQKRFTTGF
jgi:hypothetical protein